MTLPAALAALTLATNALKGAKKPKQKKQQPQPPKSKNKKHGPNRSNMSREEGLSTFAHALSDPFAPSSLGCRVPDPFPFPTQSFHLHQTTVIGTEAATTSGGIVVLPNPIFSMIDLQHVIDTTKNSVISSAMTRYSATTSNVNNGLFASSGIGAMSDAMESFRVVSWGIKISNLQPELSATGRIIIAMLPIADAVPTYSDINNTGFLVTGILPVMGVPASVLKSSALLQLPTGLEFTVGDLLHGDLEFSGMYTSNSFWEFKLPQANGEVFTGFQTGDEVSVLTSGGTVSTSSVGYKDPTRMRGGVGIVLYFEGVPVNTSAFQIETIYHLEGTPAISSNSATNPVPSNQGKPYIGSTNDVERGLACVNSVEKVVKYVDRGANFLNKNGKTIKSMLEAGRGLLR